MKPKWCEIPSIALGPPGALYMRLASWMLHHLLSIPKAEQWGIMGPWALFAMFLLLIGHCSHAIYKCFPCKKSSRIYVCQQCHVGCFQWFISILLLAFINIGRILFHLRAKSSLWSLQIAVESTIPTDCMQKNKIRVKAQCFSQHQSTGCETGWDFPSWPYLYV